jgi:tRNA 2-selenouridine synthase
LNENGLGSSTIEGGYKAYRRLVLSDLERPWPFVVIGGYTGSGKTFILHALQAMGKQMLDLEYLANHRGSAFGAFGMQPQHTSEHTMNIVHRAITALDQTQTIFVEDESQHIGSVWLHEPLYHHLRQSPLIEVRIPRDQRVRFLAAEYGAVDTTVLAESFVKIAKPLGGDRLKGALAALAVGDLEKAATMALEHYDKAYAYDLQRRQTQAVRVIEHAEVDPVAIAARILEAR